jgi:hypothetical protein
MSNHKSSVSMDELELENAELLPTRETLCVPYYAPHGATTVVTSSFTQVAGSSSAGLINLPILSGDNFDLNILGFQG